MFRPLEGIVSYLRKVIEWPFFGMGTKNTSMSDDIKMPSDQSVGAGDWQNLSVKTEKLKANVVDAMGVRKARKHKLFERVAPPMEIDDDLTTTMEPTAGKKQKRSIRFNSADVFYFPRQQGFVTVPEAGGCTLGMERQHIDYQKISLVEQDQLMPVPLSDIKTEKASSCSLADTPASVSNSEHFIGPIPQRERRALLKRSGVQMIDSNERIDCQNIRKSRSRVGCVCSMMCDPETCPCSKAGIKCQFDDSTYRGCQCSRMSCHNKFGRYDFNAAGVRSHYLKTFSRLRGKPRRRKALQNGQNKLYSGVKGKASVIRSCTKSPLTLTPNCATWS